MNGSQALITSLVDAGVEVCFMNPGTSEMHFVHALDSVQLWPVRMDAAILDMYLEDGGSVWRATERGLERRIDTEARPPSTRPSHRRTRRVRSSARRGRTPMGASRTPPTPGTTPSRRSRPY